MEDPELVVDSQATHLLVLSPGGARTLEDAGTRCNHDRAVAVWVRAQAGLGVLGGSITPKQEQNWERGIRQPCLHPVLLPGPCGMFPSGAAPASAVMVWFSSWRSCSRFVAWALHGIPISRWLQGASPRATRASAQGGFPDVTLAGSSSAWARCCGHSKPRGDVGSQGWMPVRFSDDWESRCQLRLMNWHSAMWERNNPRLKILYRKMSLFIYTDAVSILLITR